MQIPYLNSLRLLAAVCVIALHASSGVLDTRVIDSANDRFLLSCYKYVNIFAVPIFVMISGALFLNPAKETGFGIMFRKYVRRIVLALLLFGLPMCMLETYFSGNGDILTSIYNFLTGHCWAHMWYLYMLIGLYLLTPIIKPFVAQATHRQWIAALALMFVISSLLPTISDMGIDIAGYYMSYAPYIFIYMLGYWLCWKAPQKLVDNRMLHLAMIIICVGILVVRCYYDTDFYGYYDPTGICLAAAIFLLFKSINLNLKLANKLAPYCFGVYLIHAVFVNIAYKLLNVDTQAVVSPLNFVALTLLYTILSFAITYIMMKIPFLKRHIL